MRSPVWPWVACGIVCCAVLSSGCGDEESAATGATSGAGASSTGGTSATGGVGAAAGGGSGGMGGEAPCFVNCDPDNLPVRTGNIPDDVNAIFTGNCQRCHVPNAPLLQGPFDLVTYADTQQDYGSSVVWLKIKSAAVDGTFMPLQPPKLTTDERATLREWICECAPPVGGGQGGQGGAGGSGGAGGAGGTGGT